MALTNDDEFLPKVAGSSENNTLFAAFQSAIPQGPAGWDEAWVYVLPDVKEPVGVSITNTFPAGSESVGFEGWNSSFLTFNGQQKFSVPAGSPTNGSKKLYWGINTEDPSQLLLEPAPLWILDLGSP